MLAGKDRKDIMDIYEFLNKHEIAYERYDHEAVYTCEQADSLHIPVTAAKTKNLFLRDRKAHRHFLVMVGAEKSLDIKKLEVLLGVKGLSFASDKRLGKYLGLSPGAVTILGIINDVDNAVEVIVDMDLWEKESMRCHPLVNTSTLVITINDIKRILDCTGHQVSILDVPSRNG
jgi:Ala-tRNA(Pro) deacylase